MDSRRAADGQERLFLGTAAAVQVSPGWCLGVVWGLGAWQRGGGPLQLRLDSRGVWEQGKAGVTVYLCRIWVAS